MTLVLIEGFDHGSSVALAAQNKGWLEARSHGSGYTIQPTSSIVTGRIAKRGLQMTTGTNGSGGSTPVWVGWYHALTAASEYIAGGAMKFSYVNGSPCDIFWYYASGTRIMRVQWVDGGTGLAGTLQIVNSAGTLIASGTTKIQSGSWFYIEVRAKVNGASGEVELKLNGTAEIATTTTNIGSTNIDNVTWGAANAFGSSSVATTVMDDIYVLNTAGSAPRNTFLGPCRVETLMPDADGASTAWTPNSGSAHFSRVNEISGTYPDGDTSYVSTAAVGNRDTYSADNLVSTGTVFGLNVNLYARKDDVATREICPVVRQGGVNYDGTTVAMSTTYANYQQLYEQDPTAADWTAANVNADEFGVKVVT